MTSQQLQIIDAAIEVATFSRTHTWPKERSPEFHAFAQKLDALSTAIQKEYPKFNRNVLTALHGND